MIQTVTNNSPQQINAALFALDNSLENKTASLEKDIEALKKNIKEDSKEDSNDDGIISGKTYDISISGNAETADYATRAEQDADGNTISSTYVKSEDLPNVAVTSVKGDAETTYRKGNVNITKANIGLGNVDNTSDADKPISNATQTALDGKVPTSRTVNGKTLSSDITLDASDVGAATSTDITDAINALDVTEVGGNTKYISAISETDGKISATVKDVAQTYSSTGTTAASGKAIAAAIGTLDVSSRGGSGKYIQEISETNGKISATVATLDTTPADGSIKAVTSGGVYRAISIAEANAKNLANAAGTLAIAHGGTGTDSQANINTNFIADLTEGTSDVTDGTMFVSSYASDNGFSDTNAVNKPYKRKFSHVWNYIKEKISSILGLSTTGLSTGTITTTGDIHVGKDKSIYADGTKANYAIIKMKDNTSDAYGNGIVIGGGGAVVIGAGESADTYYSGASLSPGDESTRITADNTIVFASNLQNNYASRKEMIMGTDGKLTNNNGFVGDLTGNISGSSTSCTGNSATATTANYPTGFSSRGTNATWGDQTGATVTTWDESAGGSIDFRKNNPSAGKLSVKVDGRYYMNEGNTPVAGLKLANSYWGMTDPDGNDNAWIRTTNSGIIPYQSGGAGSGHNYIGTEGWYFAHAYIDQVHGSLDGNAATATTAYKIRTSSPAASSLQPGDIWIS